MNTRSVKIYNGGQWEDVLSSPPDMSAYAAKTTRVIAGAGLSGGGALSSDVTLSIGAAAITGSMIGAGPYAFTGYETHALGTITDGTPGLSITGTMPTGAANHNYGIKTAITGAGVTSYGIYAFRSELLAGYTGGSQTAAVMGYNTSANNAAASWTAQYWNSGLYGYAVATSTGHNIGGYGYASGGALNAGFMGASFTTKNSATNIGVAGLGLNAGTSPIQIGGFFALTNTTPPALTSAALLCDNVATTDPIAVFRDNGTAVLTVADGGSVIQSVANTVAVLGSELGSGSGLTQAVSGLTIGTIYYVGGTNMTAVTVDAAALPTPTSGWTSYRATATSHTFVGTGGTDLSVKALSSWSNYQAVLGGATDNGADIRSGNTTTHNLAIGSSAQRRVYSASDSTAVGYQAHLNLATGAANSAFGASSQAALISGRRNTSIGTGSLVALTTGSENCAVGAYAAQALTTGSTNMSIGYASHGLLQSGSNSVAIGGYSNYSSVSGGNNVAIGYAALYTNTGSSSIAIGFDAGRYTTDSQVVVLNSLDRTDMAGDRAKSIVYGVQNIDPSAQTLALNAQVSVPYGVTTSILNIVSYDDEPVFYNDDVVMAF